MRLSVVVQNAAKWPDTPPPASLRKWARAALGPDATGELTLRIVDADESAALNRRFRGGRGPTNVLSFPSDAPKSGRDAPIGDVVVCAPVVVDEAERQHQALEGHWAHMVVHGTLHLLGFDHETDEGAETMEARERELMAELGFPDPYS